jgi:leishmanolysin-like peptidase
MHAYYGGSVELADYCPYNQEFEWRNSSSSNKASTTTDGAKAVTHSNAELGKRVCVCVYPQHPHLGNTTLVTPPSWRRDSRCELETNIPPGMDNAALESYGVNSRCFTHAHIWTQRKCGTKRLFRFHGAGCYDVGIQIIYK